jgi:hypothetical protein
MAIIDELIRSDGLNPDCFAFFHAHSINPFFLTEILVFYIKSIQKIILEILNTIMRKNKHV